MNRSLLLGVALAAMLTTGPPAFGSDFCANRDRVAYNAGPSGVHATIALTGTTIASGTSVSNGILMLTEGAALAAESVVGFSGEGGEQSGSPAPIGNTAKIYDGNGVGKEADAAGPKSQFSLKGDAAISQLGG